MTEYGSRNITSKITHRGVACWPNLDIERIQPADQRLGGPMTARDSPREEPVGDSGGPVGSSLDEPAHEFVDRRRQADGLAAQGQCRLRAAPVHVICGQAHDTATGLGEEQHQQASHPVSIRDLGILQESDDQLSTVVVGYERRDGIAGCRVDRDLVRLMAGVGRR